MKRYSLPVFICLFANFASGQSEFNLKKDHDAFRVKDLSASANFYGGILGLKEVNNGGLGDHIRWFELNDGVEIHLIESEDKTEKNKGVHMAMKTDNLPKLIDFLKSKNIHFENWPGQAGITNTRPDGVKQIYLQDPDGYWIEINDSRS